MLLVSTSACELGAPAWTSATGGTGIWHRLGWPAQQTLSSVCKLRHEQSKLPWHLLTGTQGTRPAQEAVRACAASLLELPPSVLRTGEGQDGQPELHERLADARCDEGIDVSRLRTSATGKSVPDEKQEGHQLIAVRRCARATLGSRGASCWSLCVVDVTFDLLTGLDLFPTTPLRRITQSDSHVSCGCMLFLRSRPWAAGSARAWCRG